MLNEVDVNKTAANVRRFLTGHYRRVLRSGRSITALRSPTLDGMPRAHRTGNYDGLIVKQADAAREVEETYRAVNAMDERSCFILTNILDRTQLVEYQNHAVAGLC